MPGIQLPITYRISLRYWVIGVLVFGWGGYWIWSKPNNTVWLCVWTALFGIYLVNAFYISLVITEEGRRNRNFVGHSFKINWRQVTRLKVGVGTETNFFRPQFMIFYLKGDEPPKDLSIDWLSKKDLKQFLAIVKTKAPQAGWERTFLDPQR